MDQPKSKESLTVQNTGDDGENPSIDNQPADSHNTHQLETQISIDGGSEQDVQSKIDTNSSIYSSVNLLIHESESLCENILAHEPDHDPPPSNDEPEEKEAFASVESLENYDQKTETASIPTEDTLNGNEINSSNEFIENSSNNIQSSEISESAENNPINELQNEMEHQITTNSNEIIQDEPKEIHHDESSQIIISQCETTNPSLQRKETQSQEENQNNFNFITQEPNIKRTNEKEKVKHDPFLDLDIPKPDFSSSSDEEFEPDHLPPEEKDAVICKSPVDLETVLKTASPNENCQDRISNQSGIRIEAPREFIPSSQLMMTKKALEEGNSFLKSILGKLRSINQFLLEKTSKFLA